MKNCDIKFINEYKVTAEFWVHLRSCSIMFLMTNNRLKSSSTIDQISNFICSINLTQFFLLSLGSTQNSSNYKDVNVLRYPRPSWEDVSPEASQMDRRR